MTLACATTEEIRRRLAARNGSGGWASSPSMTAYPVHVTPVPASRRILRGLHVEVPAAVIEANLSQVSLSHDWRGDARRCLDATREQLAHGEKLITLPLGGMITRVIPSLASDRLLAFADDLVWVKLPGGKRGLHLRVTETTLPALLDSDGDPLLAYGAAVAETRHYMLAQPYDAAPGIERPSALRRRGSRRRAP